MLRKPTKKKRKNKKKNKTNSNFYNYLHTWCEGFLFYILLKGFLYKIRKLSTGVFDSSGANIFHYFYKSAGNFPGVVSNDFAQHPRSIPGTIAPNTPIILKIQVVTIFPGNQANPQGQKTIS